MEKAVTARGILESCGRRPTSQPTTGPVVIAGKPAIQSARPNQPSTKPSPPVSSVQEETSTNDSTSGADWLNTLGDPLTLRKPAAKLSFSAVQCPICKGDAVKSVPATEGFAFGSDRRCESCGTIWRPPFPKLGAVLTLILATPVRHRPSYRGHLFGDKQRDYYPQHSRHVDVRLWSS